MLQNIIPVNERLIEDRGSLEAKVESVLRNKNMDNGKEKENGEIDDSEFIRFTRDDCKRNI